MNSMISQSSKLIEDAKARYLEKVSKTLGHPATGLKTYWSLLKSVLNKARVPNIPPPLENDKFILDFTAKAEIFNDHFAKQCSTIDSGSLILHHTLPIAPPLTDFIVSSEKILSIIRSINQIKAHGWDNISVRKIKLCDTVLLFPLKLTSENCLRQGVFPEQWKKANVVPVHKEDEKNLKENYRPISLLTIFGKIFEKLIFGTFYQHLESNSLLNPNQSGFRPGDLTVNSLIHR